jgi:putative transferase (TIGR04331 family)
VTTTVALATTRLTVTPDSVPLGDWCINAAALATGEGAKSADYAGDDLERRHASNQFLTLLRDSLAEALTPILNSLHGESRSQRYWEVVSEPWLSMYVSTVCDRFETARAKVQSIEDERSIFITAKRFDRTLESYSEAVLVYGFDDSFNSDLFLDAFKAAQREFGTRVLTKINWEEVTHTRTTLDHAVSNRATGLRATLKRTLWNAFAPELRSRQSMGDFALVETSIPPAALLRLCVQLRCRPRRLPLVCTDTTTPVDLSMRRDVQRELGRWDFAGPVADIIRARIHRDIPRSVLESHPNLARHADEIERSKVVMTSNAHWSSDIFRHWAATNIDEGSSLVLAEHGAHLPLLDYCLNWEEKVATTYVPSVGESRDTPETPPATKYLRRQPAGPQLGRYLTIVTFDGPRYAVRTDSRPQSSQVLGLQETFVNLTKALPTEIRERVRLQMSAGTYDTPWTEAGWNLTQWYAARMGTDAVHAKMTLDDAISRSKILVTAYAESAFFECMLSGRPVVWLNDERFFRHAPSSEPIMQRLADVGILHSSATTAQEHIVSVWNDPQEWWQSTETRSAFAAWMDYTGLASTNGVGKWAAFLRAQLVDVDARVSNPHGGHS